MNDLNKRKDNIAKLEDLAQKVKSLKNSVRQRRPLVIEFCGSPKAGKTSSIAALNIFLKRNGFRTSVLTERASVCPISDKQSPVFNTWTCTATINEINEKIDAANAATSKDENIDIVICDRGIFDALCWFRWLKQKNKMEEDEYRILTEFAMLNRWQRNVDLVYVFLATPETSIEREYANLLTDKRGSIMNEKILKEYRDSIEQTLNEFKNDFRAVCVVETTKLTQNDVNYEVTEKTLVMLKELLMEKIGYIDKTGLKLHEGVSDFSNIKDSFKKIEYALRSEVEENSNFIQPIAIAVIVTESEEKILCVRKSKANVRADSPEFDKLLVYVGGHMRKEDNTPDCKCALDVMRNTLKRELFEELGQSLTVSKEETPFVIYAPENDRSKKHMAIVWVIKISEDTKLRLDSSELVQKKGRSNSGVFLPYAEVIRKGNQLEAWSRLIFQLPFFDNKLSEFEREALNGLGNRQISFDDSI